jgi:FHA domain
MSRELLALLNATDRSGAAVARLEVVHWPVTVGRALTADLVLDDPHVAAEHLRIDRTPEGALTVHVLDTRNGVLLNRTRYAGGAEFAWPAGELLNLGRLRLGLRQAHEPVPEEELLGRAPARAVTWTAVALAGVLAVTLFQAWITLSEPSQLTQQLPAMLMVVALALAVWSGLWALAGKLFSGSLQFWRHVRIVSFASIALQLLLGVTGALAFMFSLESLTRFESQLMLLGLAVVVYLHLAVIVPQHRKGLAGLVAGIAVLGLVVTLGTNWLQNKRLSNTLYMSAVLPPAWRLAPAVPVSQFLGEAGDIRRRLNERLKDKDSDGDGEEEQD